MTDKPDRKYIERDDRRVQAEEILAYNILACLGKRGKHKGWLGAELVKRGGMSVYSLIYEKFKATRREHLGSFNSFQVWLICDIIDVAFEDLFNATFQRTEGFTTLEAF